MRAQEKLHSDAVEADAKKTAESEEVQKQFQLFMAEHPPAALAVFLREMELRLVSLIAAGSKQEAIDAYVKITKGQQLSLLEETIYKKKDLLQQKNWPSLSSRSLVPHLKRVLAGEGTVPQAPKDSKAPKALPKKSALKAAASEKPSPGSRGRSPARSSSRKRTPTPSRKTSASTRSRSSSRSASLANEKKAKPGKKKEKGLGKGKGKGKSKAHGRGKGSRTVRFRQ